MTEEICCPKFDPSPWEEKTFQWNNKRFIKGKVCTFLYMPLNFGSVITKLMNKVDKAQAGTPEKMVLSEHTSMWNMNMYVAVDKEIENEENITFSGKYLSKVYEGDFKDTGKWMADFQKFAESKRLKIKTNFMWYTTCPKCAKKYGKNYVVNIAEVE
jgi:hypothetical protein